MAVWIIIFAVSVAGVAGMLAWRYWQTKKQPENNNESHPEYPHRDWSFSVLRGRIYPYLKNYGHEILVLSLKVWVHGAHEIKKQKEKIVPKLQTRFRKIFKHHAYIEGGNQPVSKFLDSLKNYKKRLQKIKEKIKEDLK